MLFYVLHSVYFIEFNSNLDFLKISCSNSHMQIINILKFNQVFINYFGFSSH